MSRHLRVMPLVNLPDCCMRISVVFHLWTPVRCQLYRRCSRETQVEVTVGIAGDVVTASVHVVLHPLFLVSKLQKTR